MDGNLLATEERLRAGGYEATFNVFHWYIEKLYCEIWLALVDWGRLVWERAQAGQEKLRANRRR